MLLHLLQAYNWLPVVALVAGLTCCFLLQAYNFVTGVPPNMIWESSDISDMALMCRDWTELLRRQVELERQDMNLATKEVRRVSSYTSS